LEESKDSDPGMLSGISADDSMLSLDLLKQPSLSADISIEDGPRLAPTVDKPPGVTSVIRSPKGPVPF
jgi:hypothetical protein